jgi:hypothetical protein
MLLNKDLIYGQKQMKSSNFKKDNNLYDLLWTNNKIYKNNINY